MKKKYNLLNVAHILLYIFLALTVVSYSFYQKLFIKRSIQLIIFAFLLGIVLILKAKNKQIYINLSIIYAFSTLLMFINANFSEDSDMYFYILSLFLFIILRKSTVESSVFLKIILLFSIINGIFNILGIVNETLYLQIAKKIMPSFKDELDLYFVSYGQNLGLTNHYSRNAYYIVLGLLILTPKFLKKELNKLQNIIYVFLIIVLLLTTKRGHLLYYFLTFIIFAVLLEKNILKKIIKFISVFVFTIGIIYLIVRIIPELGVVFKRFIGKDTNDISNGRLYLYSVAIKMFKKSPIIGNGYGSFRLTVNNRFVGVHNDYLQFLAEGGIILFTLMLILIINNYNKTYKAMKLYNYNSNLCNIAFVIQTFIITYAVTGVAFYDYAIFIVYFYCAALGIEKYRQALKNCNF